MRHARPGTVGLRFPHQLTLEEWRLPNDDDLVEASIKTLPGRAGKGASRSTCARLGIDPKGAQETKTYSTLKHFAKAYRNDV